MGKFIDLTGQKFGRLTVIKRVENTDDGRIKWLCLCECGKKIIVQAGSLKGGNTKSCGCFHKEQAKNANYKHGHSSNGIISHTYITWIQIIQRCTNPKRIDYKNYGGRGIKICEAWMKFEGFLQDMGERPSNTSIDRVNNNGNYCKENCKWSTRKEQQRNKRDNKSITIGDETKCIAGWCEELGLRYHTVITRLRRGWSDEEALEIVSRKQKTKKN